MRKTKTQFRNAEFVENASQKYHITYNEINETILETDTDFILMKTCNASGT